MYWFLFVDAKKYQTFSLFLIILIRWDYLRHIWVCDTVCEITGQRKGQGTKKMARFLKVTSVCVTGLQAIQNPGDLALQEKAWNAVCPLVAKLKRFYEFSLRLGECGRCSLWRHFGEWCNPISGGHVGAESICNMNLKSRETAFAVSCSFMREAGLSAGWMCCSLVGVKVLHGASWSQENEWRWGDGCTPEIHVCLVRQITKSFSR